MLNIKSKAFKFLVGTLAVVAFSYASAAMDFGSTTLRVGSKGEAVKAVQTCVGATADGSFGPMTKAKVMAWQSSMGLTADGVFGPMSKAKAANGCGTTPAPVSQGNCPAGYVAIVPAAPTWAACAMSTTISTGTNGYLTDINLDSTNRVSTVYESEQDKVVAGMRVTARLADQTVSRVRVTFKNTNSSSSANLGKYISGATLWMDSTKLATMSVAQADRSTSDDTYTFNFSGINAKVAKDMVGKFFVSVSANGSLDTNDTTNANWTVKFTSGGVNASSPDGTYDTYPSSDLTQTGLTFGKFSANGVKSELNLSASNPAATVLTVQNTAVTNGVNLLKFTIKATNSDLNLRKIPIQVTINSATAADDVTNVINTLKLYRGTDLVDTVDPSASTQFTAGSASNPSGTLCTNTANAADDLCAFFFSNLASNSTKITSGTTAEFTVVADLKQVSGNYAEGTTVQASFANPDVLLAANYSVQDTNGDQLTNNNSSIRVGSAVGNTMTLYINGVNVVMGTPVITNTTSTGGLVESVTYAIPVTATAFGNTLYVGQTVQSAATVSGTNALAFVVQDNVPNNITVAGTAAANVMVGSAVMSTSDALVEGSGYRLDSGSAKHFTVTVTVTGLAASGNGSTAGYYRVALKQFQTFTNSGLSTGATALTLNPATSYQTGYSYLNQ
jgi:peptidoglycan hydrolase-like protein with peptidoglycan-binding domain